MPRLWQTVLTILVTLSACASERTALAQSSVRQILNPDPEAGDWFGTSVAMDGTVAIVGAPLDDEAANNTGAAYIYRWNGTAWLLEQKLMALEVVPNDWLGVSVAIDGDVAVIGAFGSPGLGFTGAAYVFRFAGSRWSQEQKLTASDAQKETKFGCRVDICGPVVVVGARDAAGGEGAAYVFRFDGSDWEEEKRLIPPDQPRRVQYGWDVAVDTGTIVIGTNRRGGYVYRHEGGTWKGTQLVASDGKPGDRFGGTVQVSGDTLLVGASGADCQAGRYCGAVYSFRRRTGSWVEDAKLVALDARPNDLFGGSLALNEGTAVIGSALRVYSTEETCGAIHIAEFDGSAWSVRPRLVASSARGPARYRYSIAASDGRVLLGLSLDDTSGDDAGVVYALTQRRTPSR